MDKPTIIAVKPGKPREEQVGAAVAPAQAAETPAPPKATHEEQPTGMVQAPEPRPAEAKVEARDEPEQQAPAVRITEAPKKDEMTDLEKSVLAEVVKRGEMAAEEAATVREREAEEEAEELSKAIENPAVPAPRPRVIINHTTAADVLENHRKQASRDILPVRNTPGAMGDSRDKPLSKEELADLARKIHEQKAREKSIFHRIKRLAGLGG